MIVEKFLNTCESTNQELKKAFREGAIAGSWIATHQQVSGRGRGDHVWESFPGNLYASFLIQISKKEWLSWVPIMAGVEILKAIQKTYPEFEFRLKWPNDLKLDGKKLGGILCEAVQINRAPCQVIVGVGLNIAGVPAGLETIAGHLPLTGKGNMLSLMDWVQRIREALLEGANRINENGFDVYCTEFHSVSEFRPEQRIQWLESGTSREGLYLGLGSQGQLQVKTKAGIQNLFSEEVSAIRS